jgi:hypothetical protein
VSLEGPKPLTTPTELVKELSVSMVSILRFCSFVFNFVNDVHLSFAQHVFLRLVYMFSNLDV